MDNRLERSKKIVIEKEYEETANEKNLHFLKLHERDMYMRELSEASIYNYKRDLLSWFAYINKMQFNKSVEEIDEEDIEEFIFYCQMEGNNIERRRRRLSSISAFYKFLRKKRLVKENPVEFVSRPRKGRPVVQKNWLTLEQVYEIRNSLKELDDKQLTAYFEVSLCTMARVNAVSSIKWGQIDFDNYVINNVLEKEGYIVTLYLDDTSVKALQELKEYRDDNNIIDDNVFLVKYGEKYKGADSNNLYQWAKKIGTLCNPPVETLSPHDFRRSGATLKSRAGMPIEQVSSHLNHKGIDVTRLYIKEDEEQKGKQFREFTI